jgi:putative tryptophan/tyrosine transport system substrate-binding protein
VTRPGCRLRPSRRCGFRLMCCWSMAMASAHSALQLTKTIPVIFIGSGDPVADGLLQSISHPGGNVTGFAVMEPTLGAKLLGMLKQIAPRVTRVAVLMNPTTRPTNMC